MEFKLETGKFPCKAAEYEGGLGPAVREFQFAKRPG